MTSLGLSPLERYAAGVCEEDDTVTCEEVGPDTEDVFLFPVAGADEVA